MGILNRLFGQRKKPPAITRSEPTAHDPALIANIREQLRQLPVVAEALGYHSDENENRSWKDWTEKMSLDRATEFLLQRAGIESWRLGQRAAWQQYLETTYLVGMWQRFFRVWRVSDLEYIGCDNLNEDIS